MTKKPVTVSITITIDPRWLEFCGPGNVDVFRRDYCGDWAFGMACTKTLGWLIFDYGDDVLDLDTVKKAYVIAVKLWGENWMKRGDTDGTCYDRAIQTALFGEVKYG